MEETRLCKLACKWRTDKCPGLRHSYTPFYDELLGNKPVRRLLEIGIGYQEDMRHVPGYITGASLRMWEEYFPEAEIFGLDINEKILFNEGRIKTLQADQSNGRSLATALERIGGDFDVIIDDGSHDGLYQGIAALNLVPALAKDGIYIIENVSHPAIVTHYLPWECEVKTFRQELGDDRIIIIRR